MAKLSIAAANLLIEQSIAETPTERDVDMNGVGSVGCLIQV